MFRIIDLMLKAPATPENINLLMIDEWLLSLRGAKGPARGNHESLSSQSVEQVLQARYQARVHLCVRTQSHATDGGEQRFKTTERDSANHSRSVQGDPHKSH
jgi:hypothetical protein